MWTSRTTRKGKSLEGRRVEAQVRRVSGFQYQARKSVWIYLRQSRIILLESIEYEL